MREILLTQGQVAKVDDEDYEELAKHKWHATWCLHRKSFVAMRHISDSKRQAGRTTLLMHRQIMGAQPGQEIDHRNHDTLDNRRANLRICTHAQNMHNSKAIGGTSKFKGVCWYKSRSRWASQWVASIGCGGKKLHLGYFLSEEEAARAYDRKARELWGEFAFTNF